MAISKKITPPFDYWQNFDVHSQQSTFDLMDRFDRLDARLSDMDHRVDSFAFPEPPEPDPPYDLDCDIDDDFRVYRRRSRGDKEHAALVFNFNRGEDSRLRHGGFLGQPQRPCGRDVGRDSPRQQPSGARFPQVRQQPTSSWDCTAAHDTIDAEKTYRGVFYCPPRRTTGRKFPRQQPSVARVTPQQPQQRPSGWARPTARSHSGRSDFHQQQTIGTWVPPNRPRQSSSWDCPADRKSTGVEQAYRGLRQQPCWDTPPRCQIQFLQPLQDSPPDLKMTTTRFDVLPEEETAIEGHLASLGTVTSSARSNVEMVSGDLRRDSIDIINSTPEGVRQTAALLVSEYVAHAPSIQPLPQVSVMLSVPQEYEEVIESEKPKDTTPPPQSLGSFLTPQEIDIAELTISEEGAELGMLKVAEGIHTGLVEKFEDRTEQIGKTEEREGLQKEKGGKEIKDAQGTRADEVKVEDIVPTHKDIHDWIGKRQKHGNIGGFDPGGCISLRFSFSTMIVVSWFPP